MPTVRSTRFVDPTLPANGNPVSLYTVPLGRVALVKSIRVVNVTDVAHAFHLQVGPPPATGWLFKDATVGPRMVLTDETWWVMEAGDELLYEVDAGDALAIMVSGALLVA